MSNNEHNHTLDNAKIKVESDYPLSCAELKTLLEEEYDLFIMKQHDYGPNNIACGQDLNTEEGRRISKTGLVFRLNDKIQRLFNLQVKNNDNEKPVNESIEDTLKDISLYCKIFQLVERKKWGK